ncbi:hydroxyphenylacetyl-CoA thioesterase PaaI [Rhodococcus chondri]|uniref:Hydroxyphenylacetyl-CoA thioesterase PaaI n=1 Tax=Rhodococcus chondri TaxID=3065941 RepID=A0ABU7JKS7_9NOCA|nr:hydroxyphenylacetyl-CoA thioesterase PaaI [Rhodococcus sp. CC-R104]MEE2030643.1 hydroxyphenylacetyl-CoA thioesterase PaaI [Rhodococcus sp. CC-R104]
MTTVDHDPCRVAREMFAADTASRALGIEVLELEQGRATASLAVTETMVNGHGITHGGYVFLLADTAFALACNSYDLPAVGARADIRYLRPTRLGDTLTAVAVERSRSGRNGIYDVTVTDSAGAVIAEFRGDSRVITPR